MTSSDLVFVGLNGRVVALNRETGDEVWQWVPATSGHRGFVALTVDSDRLIASDNGYIYCLDARTGQEVWHNPLTGYGTGIAVVVTGRSSSGQVEAGAAQRAQEAAAAAATGAIIASSS